MCYLSLKISGTLINLLKLRQCPRIDKPFPNTLKENRTSEALNFLNILQVLLLESTERSQISLKVRRARSVF